MEQLQDPWWGLCEALEKSANCSTGLMAAGLTTWWAVCNHTCKQDHVTVQSPIGEHNKRHRLNQLSKSSNT